MEPLASWLRVWDWSPVLAAALLAGFAPPLAAVRRLRPAGPPDPRAVERLVPLTRIVALEEDLAELTAAAGPLRAAGAGGYAIGCCTGRPQRAAAFAACPAPAGCGRRPAGAARPPRPGRRSTVVDRGAGARPATRRARRRRRLRRRRPHG
ncbi:hypothetical protein ACFU7T_14460 [Streptomyces sp. NPDC057555]|uniref:hypothetical protein n=1 Tax=Streptomyces sp. NPDC057555 TaxID=3346166 RepID=UPI003683BF29